MTREIDVRVAEVMGLGLVQGQAPRYSEDIVASRDMEDWIEEHGLQPRYAMAMMSVLLQDGRIPDHDELLWWMLLHATPEQRCRAFLEAMGK